MKINFTTKMIHRFSAFILVLGLLFSTDSQMYGSSSVWPFTLNCPGNITVSCTDEIWNLSKYGNATYSTHYGTYSAGAPIVKYFLNSCNTGYITRTWKVEDHNWVWHSCTQIITVSGGWYHGGPNIQWPKDYVATGCNPDISPSKLSPPYNYPTWTSSPCSILGRSYSDMTFTIGSGCKKVLRTWKIMDWCISGSSYPSSGGMWTHVQEIKIMDSHIPEVVCVPEIIVSSTNCVNAYVNAASLHVDPTVCGGFYEISNNSPYSISKGANISGTYPIGTTKVRYTVKYGCGLTKVCNVNVVVKNDAKPTPYCLAHIITTLMPLDTDKNGVPDEGMVQIWAKDLDFGSKASCGFSPLRFSFSTDPTDMSKTFTCANVGKNNLLIYVTDSKGGQSACFVTVHIQNNSNIPNCPPLPPDPEPEDPTEPEDPQGPESRKVEGVVTDAFGKVIKGVDIKLSYTDGETVIITRFDTTTVMTIDSFLNLSGYWVYRHFTEKLITQHKDTLINYESFKTLTNVAGQYKFENLPRLDENMVIRASYNDTIAAQNINSKDVEALTKYLLGELEFESPYQYLAADVDENGIIDLNDLTRLLEFVTKHTSSFPGKNSWFFIPEDMEFVKPQDILDSVYNDFIYLDSVPAIGQFVDIIAIQKGNIVNTVQGNLKHNAEVELNFRGKESASLIKPKLFPNPFSQTIQLNIDAVKDEDILIRMYNAGGRVLYENKYAVSKGTNEISINPEISISGLILYQIISGDQLYSGTILKI